MNKKSAIAFSLAPIVVSAIGFIFLPILSWWLAEDEMAKFAMFQANVNFFTLIVSLGLDQALAREFHETRSPGKLLRRVLQLVLLAIPVGVLGLGIIKLIADGLASATITLGMTAACVLMLLNRMYSSYIRMSGDGVAYAVDIVTPKAFQLIILGLIGSQSTLVITYDVVVRIVVVSAAAALCYEIFMAGRIGRAFDAGAAVAGSKELPRRAELLRFGVPLVPGALAFYAISASTVYIIGAHGNSREVVTAALAISVGGGLAVLQSVFTTLWVPFAYRWHATEGSPALYQHIATMVTFACSLLLLVCLFVAPYLALLFPEKYSGLPRLLVPVIVWNSLYLILIVGSFGLGVKRKSLTTMTIHLTGAALSIAMSVVASSYFGALGALLSVLAAFVVTLVLNCECSARAWIRVVGPHHYLMVGTMTASGVLFSLGYDWQSQVLLVVSIVFYLPTFRSSSTQAYAIYTNASK